jgi:hypothetical protein
MRVTIQTIPHEAQDYSTCGDWTWGGDNRLDIFVSETGNREYNLLIALHEFVEAILCKRRSITEDKVTAFDVSHPELAEPGDDPKAPYHREHIEASCIEILFGNFLEVDWKDYANTVNALGGDD